MSQPLPGESPLLTPAEVASRFRVDPKTVNRWARKGKLRSVRTLGGVRRYYRAQVEALLRGEELTGAELDAIALAAAGA